MFGLYRLAEIPADTYNDTTKTVILLGLRLYRSYPFGCFIVKIEEDVLEFVGVSTTGTVGIVRF